MQREQSIILEKESDIVEDPRGVYLAADAIRILYALGLGDVMPKIGHRTIRWQVCFMLTCF
jgi:2-polyprenyl-6-methoxyphenol hydroxylase-like FAD-dependent oxidoreductase